MFSCALKDLVSIFTYPVFLRSGRTSVMLVLLPLAFLLRLDQLQHARSVLSEAIFDFRKSLKVLAVLMPVSVTCAFRLMLSRSASLARTRNLLQSQSLYQGAVYMNKFSRCCCNVAASPISLLFSAPAFAQWQSAVGASTLLLGICLLSMLLLALQCTLLPLLAAPC
jgi:hypothetical protein